MAVIAPEFLAQARRVYSIVHIPKKHVPYPFVGLRATVYDHPKAAVDHLSPSLHPSVLQRNPGGAPERIANDIMYGHIGSKGRSVVNIGCFSCKGNRPGDIVVIAAKPMGAFILPSRMASFILRANPIRPCASA
jgi:hypothetical protein